MLQNPWIAHKPTRKQALFLLHDRVHEVLFGGAAGGGKSISLLMAALQYVDMPGYNALILRRNFPQLEKAGALIDIALNWLSGKATWNGTKHRWTFPSGASLTFGHVANEADKYNYQGAQYHFIGFDELSQFTESIYRYLFSRMRKIKSSSVPLRVRCASNPGGAGMAWVKQRFIPADFLKAPPEEQFGRTWWNGRRLFVPSKLEDNQNLDIGEYEAMLQESEPLEFKQLRHGDWKAHAGGRFRPEWWRRYRLDVDTIRLDDGTFQVMHEVPRIVLLDPANRKTKTSKYSAIGVYADLGEQRVAILEMVRRHLSVEQIIPELNRVCGRWQPEYCGIEANGFQLALVKEARDRNRYPHIPTVLELEPEGKSKLTRATPAIIRAEQGLFYLPQEADWLEDFEVEHQQFTGDEKEDTYTDQVDDTAYAVICFDRYGVGGGGLSLEKMTL